MQMKTIEGFSRYFANEDGEIVSMCGPVPRVLVGNLDWQGYRKMVLVGDNGKHKTFKRASFVCRAFHGPRQPGMVARHLDGTKTNDRPSNLAWGTYRQNTADRYDHGTAAIGSKNPRSRLSESQVREIRSGFAGSIVAMARKYGVSEGAVAGVVYGRSWAWLK
jgi:hypothetical protein